jgi:hypothetical protein
MTSNPAFRRFPEIADPMIPKPSTPIVSSAGDEFLEVDFLLTFFIVAMIVSYG